MFNPAQLSALKAVASADQTALALMAAADDIGLAAWFNTEDAAFTVWKTRLTVEDCNTAIVWIEVDALTNGKARIWEWMTRLGAIDPSQLNVRQGLSDAFASANGTKAALAALGKRLASTAEKTLATGTGSNASPALLTFEGLLSYADASDVRVA